MSKTSVPGYLLHKRSGKARVLVRDHLGGRREIWLPGAYNSLESKQAYERLLGELRRNGGQLPPLVQPESLTVNELILLFWERKVRVDYVNANQEPTSEQGCQRQALRPLRRLFGLTQAARFDARALKDLQHAMADGSWLTTEERESRERNGKPTNWCRTLVNRNISRIRSMFKWGVAEKLIAPAVWAELQAVAPLKKGRGARESMPVTPVDPVIVEATIPHLPPHVADMVRVQLLTGARPGEICAMRPMDIDRSDDVWIFAPAVHKTQHHGHVRQIAMGPQVQAILQRRLHEVGTEEHVFSPARQHAELMHAKRCSGELQFSPLNAIGETRRQRASHATSFVRRRTQKQSLASKGRSV
jgi:integrase